MTAAPRARRLATALVVLTALALGPHAPGAAAPKPPTGTIDEYPTMASFSAPPSPPAPTATSGSPSGRRTRSVA